MKFTLRYLLVKLTIVGYIMIRKTIRIVAAILIGIMMDQFGVSGKEYVEITE